MKCLFTHILLFFSTCVVGQEKGASPVNPQLEIGNLHSTRAVVVGISDYQDPDIPDLRFADKDAEAFASFLRSPAGGSLSNDQIVLLTNAKATTAQFSAALDWLIEQSNEEDQAIIYFSGHGDVETKTIANWGFLLTYSSPPINYIAGAFPIYFLQSVIATLSQKNVKVVMISDACHAGKLAGSEFGGSQTTALNLAKQFANEVKIMSCQPDEFSIEGEQWGGGRGAFSYHLIEGLTGFADKNSDWKVQLLEIENYLEEILPKETDPQTQIPMTAGVKSHIVSLVDAASLTALKEFKSKEMPTLAKVEAKGFESTILEKADSSVQELYAAFLAAIEKGDLLEPKAKSANDFYELLIHEESLKPLYGFMKRNLAAALHDNAQVALTLYLNSDTVEINKRFRLDSSYFHYPRYLSRAAELLGEGHYMYRNLKGKQYYFEGVLKRLERDKRIALGQIVWGDSTHNKLINEDLRLQRLALSYEEKAAFIYHEIALSNVYLGNMESALENYQKSATLSPSWALTYANLGGIYYSLGRYEEAISVLQTSVELKSTYGYGYLAACYRAIHQYGKSIEFLARSIKADSSNIFALSELGLTYTLLSDWEKARRMYQKVLELKPYDQNSQFMLGIVMSEIYPEKAIEILSPFIENTAYRKSAIAAIGLAKIDMAKEDEGLRDLMSVLDDDDGGNYIFYGRGLLKLNRQLEAQEAFNTAYLKIKQEKGALIEENLYEIMWSCAVEGEQELALRWIKQLAKDGYLNYGRLQFDHELDEVRKTKKFKDLMKKYFPDQIKD